MHRWEAPHARRAAGILGVAGLLVVAAVALSQCRIVEDRVTGVDLRTSSGLDARSDCVRACNDRFIECKRAADERHRSDLAGCNGLTGLARAACNKDANDRFQIAHQRCVELKDSCKDACYNEGAGSGGF